MPRTDGPTLVEEVHKIYPQLKVLFISGHTEDRVFKDVVQTANVHFLPKPFDIKELSTKVKEILG
jgi:two-component system cell cycle sensor histidine kinase/response regulator CckA